MQAKNEANGILKVSAILMIVFAVIGMTVMAVLSWQEASAVISNLGAEIDFGDGTMMPTNTFVAIGAAIVAAASLIGNAPRLVAGIMGLSRCKNPEKNVFFMAWGVVLLVLGVAGLLFSGWALSANWLSSIVGGIILPICYIIGALQQKREYMAFVAERAAAEAVIPVLEYPSAEEVDADGS